METGKVKGLLTNKIGPLPAIGWAGMVGGTYVAYAYYKRRKTGTAPTVTPTVAPVDTSLGTATNFSNGFSNATGSYLAGGSSATTAYVPQAVGDNVSWAKQATNYLIALGVDPTVASHSIATYMYGTGATLNATESAALNNALTHFGVPPEGVIDPPTTTPIAPTTNPTVTTPVTASQPQITQILKALLGQNMSGAQPQLAMTPVQYSSAVQDSLTAIKADPMLAAQQTARDAAYQTQQNANAQYVVNNQTQIDAASAAYLANLRGNAPYGSNNYGG